MNKPAKVKIGSRLLLGLIPALIILIIAVALSNDDTPALVAFIGVLSLLYLIAGSIVGLALIVLGNREFKRAYQTAQRYAELNGWHPISRTSWRNRKRDQTALFVHQAFDRPTYILTVEANVGTTVIDEFETPIWALQFGDWLWEQLLDVNTAPNIEEVAEKRAEWEQTTALAIRPHTPPSTRREQVRIPPPLRGEVFHAPPGPHAPSFPKSKTTAAILAILLGWVGAHKFYLGHTGLGILLIAISLFTFGTITFLIGLAEGIIYLTTSDEDFQYVYIQERKAWF